MKTVGLGVVLTWNWDGTEPQKIPHRVKNTPAGFAFLPSSFLVALLHSLMSHFVPHAKTWNRFQPVPSQFQPFFILRYQKDHFWERY